MTTLESLHKEIQELKSDVEKILEILEEYELTDDAKKALSEARKIPESEYVSHEDVKK